MKSLYALDQGDYVQFVHNTGRIKKNFTIGKNYLVLKTKHICGAIGIESFTIKDDKSNKRTIMASTDQFKVAPIVNNPISVEELKHPWPELNKMSPSDLLVLRKFCREYIRKYRKQSSKREKWLRYLAIVQQHIDKSTAHYFGEESRS